MDYHISNFSSSTNLVNLSCVLNSINCRISFVYGSKLFHDRVKLWDHIAFSNDPLIPWICLGDFNQIISNSKKYSIRQGYLAQIKALQLFVANCSFLDLSFHDNFFTLLGLIRENNWFGSDWIKSWVILLFLILF